MREIYSHTALRGMAAILVVLFHYRVIFEPTFNIDRYTSFLAKSYLWVDCFFMLSGFILCHVYGTSPGENQRSRLKFLQARFARIYPLHLATLTVLASFQVIVATTNHPIEVGSWATFWPNLFGVHAWLMPNEYEWNFPSWSISVEFAAYLLFPAICHGLLHYRRLTIALLALGVMAALPIDHDHWERTAVMRGLPMFCLGIILFQVRDTITLCPSIAPFQIVVAVALAAALHFGAHDVVIDVLFAALVWLTWTDQGAAPLLRSRPLQSLGEWSFSIYMLHIPVRIIVGFVVGARVSPAASVAIMLVLTLCAGALSYRCFEMPVRGLLRKRKNAATV